MTQYGVGTDLFKEKFKDFSVIGIEIGTGCADLTRTILWALPGAFLYTIDSWEHRDGAEFEAGEAQEKHDRTKEEALKRLAAPDVKDRVRILHMKSRDALSLVPSSVDFVWIDGDHSQEGITTDLDLYYPLVKEGGIFGGHDYGQCHPLTEIIFERFGDRIKTGDDFTWWVIK